MDDLSKPAKMRDGMQTNVCDVALVDLEKIRDALLDAAAFFQHRDDMNAHVHLAKQTRISPLTSKVLAAEERLSSIIGCNMRTDVEAKP